MTKSGSDGGGLSDVPFTFSREEAAEHLGIGLKTLGRLTSQGRVPAIRLGRRVRYAATAILALVEGRNDLGREVRS